MTIYFLQMERSGFIKIGYTATDAAKRMAQLQTGQPDRIKLLGTMPGTMDDEKSIHRELSEYRVNGEWFIPETVDIANHLIDKQGPWYLCREPEINRRKMEIAWVSSFSNSEPDPFHFCLSEKEIARACKRFLSLDKVKLKFEKRQGAPLKNKRHAIYNIVSDLSSEMISAANYIRSYSLG